ncbi:juvenile hormone esterase-like isoform X1 [Periplaneta americana]|uniref:juvenile hormone esterase-like isoform X1 n=1 Tax=Periplaneta americana TaxID=6978 RepID=UPI0037E8401D
MPLSSCTTMLQLWCCCLAALLVYQAQGKCLVSKQEASVQGSQMTSRNGRNFCSFRGMPYAAPPVGPLRFKAPQPVDFWNKKWNATVDGPMCIQKTKPIVGQEDCLYLNVYTPLTTFPSVQTFPVIVYFHGGSMEKGSGVSTLYHPKYFLDKDIVLVTINYRLGVFGFISTGDDEAPGNFGLKDQVAALRWVRDNIAELGGDPNKVTLQGQSAGAQSINYHMFSPLSRGLFHAAMSESGSAYKANVIPVADPLAKAKQQAELVDCPVDDSSVLINCLRDVDANLLIKKQIKGAFKPVVEIQSASNPEPFVTDSPLNLVQSGDFYRVPWILGCNSEEGIRFVSGLLLNQADLDNLNNNFDAEAYSHFFLPLSLDDSLIPSVWKQITESYFANNHTVTPDNVATFVKMASDRIIIHTIHKAAQLHTRAGHGPIYFYNLAYRGKYSFTGEADYGEGKVNLGVGHTDDVIYFFKRDQFPEVPEDHPDREVSEALITLWTNFAIYGSPTPPGGDVPQGIEWQPINANDSHTVYMKFGHADPPSLPSYGIMPLKISMEQDLNKERMEFWDSLPLKENIL